MNETIRRQRRQSLTDRQVAALPRKRKRYPKADPELRGHYLRVPPTGPITFYAVTANALGRQTWTKLGTTAELTIEQARERAREVIKRLKAGLPAFEPKPPEPKSVAQVASDWFTRHVKANGLRTAREKQRILDRYVLPHWRDREFAKIKRSDIKALLDTIEDKHGAHQADAVRAVLSSLSTWYMEEDDDYQTPFSRGVRRRVVDQKRQSRDRILTDDELRRVWRAAEADAGPFGSFIQICLLTAQRRAKISTLRWDDIASGIWNIRTEPREKGTPGQLPLSPQALAIIARQPRFVSSPYVFTGYSGSGRIVGFSGRFAAFKDQCGVSSFRLHDLRRCARSLMSRASVPSEHAERVMGHVIGGVEGIYDRHAYTAEKGAALAKLAALIERIVHPPDDNVVALHERQKEVVP